MNPPGHHPDAKDFVSVDKSGKPYNAFSVVPHLFYWLKVNDTYSWSKPVLAPFDGQIVKTECNHTDRTALNIVKDIIGGLLIAPRKYKNDPQFFLGNHIIIKSDEGVYALLAHLKKGSITLNEGMRVKAGDSIAKVGNSGNTIQPHLHFHLMSENDPLASAPRPFVINEYEVKKKSSWEKEYLSLPSNFTVFRIS